MHFIDVAIAGSFLHVECAFDVRQLIEWVAGRGPIFKLVLDIFAIIILHDSRKTSFHAKIALFLAVEIRKYSQHGHHDLLIQPYISDASTDWTNLNIFCPHCSVATIFIFFLRNEMLDGLIPYIHANKNFIYFQSILLGILIRFIL